MKNGFNIFKYIYLQYKENFKQINRQLLIRPWVLREHIAAAIAGIVLSCLVSEAKKMGMLLIHINLFVKILSFSTAALWNEI